MGKKSDRIPRSNFRQGGSWEVFQPNLPTLPYRGERMGDTKGKIVFPDTYGHRFTCGNCSSSVALRIPIGITVWEYTKDHKCLNCGCMLLPQEDKPYRYSENTPMVYLPYYGLRR